MLWRLILLIYNFELQEGPPVGYVVSVVALLCLGAHRANIRDNNGFLLLYLAYNCEFVLKSSSTRILHLLILNY